MKDRLIREIADAAFDFDAIQKAIKIIDFRRAGGRSENAHEHADGSGLARAIRAEERENFTAGNRQIEILNRLKCAVPFGQTLDFD